MQSRQEIGTQLSFALYGAANRMNRLHKPFLDPLGLTFPQYLVMLELYNGTPRSVGDIGHKLGMDTGTITPLLKRLESAGRIIRTRDRTDERRVLITLTDNGYALQKELWQVTERIKSACQLSDVKLEELRDTLNGFAHPADNRTSSTQTKGTGMKIGIIGAGNIGSTLAHKLSGQGHTVKLANSRGPETIAELAQKVGAVAVERQEAVRDVDVIILSIPFDKHAELTELLRDIPDNVIVIDTSNYYAFRDGDIREIREGKPESVYASEIVRRPLIKAWNAVLAETLKEKGLAVGSPSRIAIPVAGDAPAAKSVVMELVRQTGFDAVDAGTLSESWRQQPGTPAYCTELNAEELEAALQSADKTRAPLNRDALIKEFMSAGDQLTHDVIIKRNRAVTAPVKKGTL